MEKESWRSIRLNLDNTYKVFDLGLCPDLNRQISPLEDQAPFGLVFLNGPTHQHPDHVTVGIAVDQEGYQKQLPANTLANALWGVFGENAKLLVGTAVIVASDFLGGIADVPYWVIDLVREIKRSLDLAFRYHQNVGYN